MIQNLIQTLESLESTQLNLGLYTTHITAEGRHRAIAEAESTAPPLSDVEAALHDLVAQGEVIEWAPGLFRSRIAETVRCLRLLRQRLWWQRDLSDAPLLIEDIRVEFRQRQRPKRDAVLVDETMPDGVSPEIAEAFIQAIGFPSFSGFQGRAVERVFICAQQGNPENESFIIAGDTGAGKTEAFLFPILLDIAGEPPEMRQRPGVRAVLVYPRIRLARNQLGRLLRYTGRFRAAGGPRLTVGTQNGDVPRDKAILAEGWTSEERDGRVCHRVDLLEVCVECDEGHYWLAADDLAIETGCPCLVCDHCGHMMDTLHVTKAALTRSAPDVLIITDVSLSQWLAREKYTHLWGLWQGGFLTVPPRFLVLDEVHLYERLKGAHIARLIKRFQARVRLVYKQMGEPHRHPVVIGASATLHDKQRFLAKLMDVDPQDTPRYERLQVISPEEHEEAGQVRGAPAVAVQPDRARDFIADGDWERRWGGDEHKPYETPGGVRVRSRAEYIIVTKLEAAGIAFEYEPRLAYRDDEGRTRFIHPDFYLYEHGLYVEYWGRDDPEYVESRRFKEKVYEQLAARRSIRVLHLEAGDVENDVFLGKVQTEIGSNEMR